jgi:hypothetical protein
MTKITNFRLSAEQRANCEQLLAEYRKATGDNMTISELLRRCVDIGLLKHRAELLKGGTR